MKINESKFDSVIRIAGGVVLLYLSSSAGLSTALAIVSLILGVVLLLTGAVGFCPLYALFRGWRK